MIRFIMFPFLFAAASVILMAPSEPLEGQLQSAIWADLQLNAMIGNGSWLASLWYNAGDGLGPDLHIRGLQCAMTSFGQRCSFDLYRDGGPTNVLGETAPDKLACVAAFAHHSDGWSVIHAPPRGAGHSKTSMECKTSSSD